MLFGPIDQWENRLDTFGGHALPKLGQVVALQATALHIGVQRIQVLQAQGVRRIPGGVCDFPCDLVPGDAIGHAAQVLQQHHTQGGWQGPEFAQAEFADFLVGMQESNEQHRVQHAVGMRHIGPGNAIDTRQARQRFVEQFGQG